LTVYDVAKIHEVHAIYVKVKNIETYITVWQFEAQDSGDPTEFVAYLNALPKPPGDSKEWYIVFRSNQEGKKADSVMASLRILEDIISTGGPYIDWRDLPAVNKLGLEQTRERNLRLQIGSQGDDDHSTGPGGRRKTRKAPRTDICKI
jgi:hypothetical protein